MTFDPTKPVQTRSGMPARIICTDRADPIIPIIALYKTPEGCEGVIHCKKDGSYSLSRSIGQSNFDLVNVPETVVEYYLSYYIKNDPKTTTLIKKRTEERAREDARKANAARDMWVASHILKLSYEDGIPVKTELLEI
jgi:hypothetical protein